MPARRNRSGKGASKTDRIGTVVPLLPQMLQLLILLLAGTAIVSAMLLHLYYNYQKADRLLKLTEIPQT